MTDYDMNDMSDLFEATTLPEDTDQDEAKPTSEAKTEEPKKETQKADEQKDPQTDQKKEPQKEPEKNPEAKPETIQLKYNHESYNLTKQSVEDIAKSLGVDEGTVVTMLQMGKDYPGKSQRLKELEGRLDSIARNMGVDRNGVFEMMSGAAKKAAINSISKQIKTAHPEYTDASVAEIAELRYQEQVKNAESQNAAQAQQEHDAQNQPMVEFFMRHPDITPDNIPQEVIDEMSNGSPIEQAYANYEKKKLADENAQLKAQLEGLKKTETNKQKAIGSVTSEAEKETTSLDDAFFAAFK